MEPTHVHLLVNHIPILGSLFGALLLLVGMLIKNRSVEVTGLATILIAALFTLPAYFSGEEAEHIIEKFQGISEYELEEHEEHAELSLWLMIASGVLSLLTLVSYVRAKHLTRSSRVATLVITFFGFITMIPLALHGGKIVHSELRSGEDTEMHEHHDEHEEHEEHH